MLSTASAISEEIDILFWLSFSTCRSSSFTRSFSCGKDSSDSSSATPEYYMRSWKTSPRVLRQLHPSCTLSSLLVKRRLRSVCE